MNKSIIGSIFYRSIVKELQIPTGCDRQVQEAMEFRFLNYPEDLKDCVMLEGIDKGSLSIQYNYKSPFDQGESLGYFSKSNDQFYKNEHWSERMRLASKDIEYRR